MAVLSEENSTMQFLQTARSKDMSFSSGKILGSMYTEPLPQAVDAHHMFIEANLGNRGLYPGTCSLEEHVKSYLSDLLALPHNGTVHMTSGGTESNITALWMARNLFGYRTVYLPESAHFSLRKAADLLALRARSIPLDENYRADTSVLEELTASEPGIIVGTAGTTELGQIDPIETMSHISVSSGSFLHVDAAFGGLVIPYLQRAELLDRNIKFSFDLEGVETLTCDPHKMLMSTTPLGSLLMKSAAYLESVGFSSPYLSTPRSYGLLGTRSSGAVAAASASIKILGHKGMQSALEKCMSVTSYFHKRCKEEGLELAIDPIMNIASVRMPDPKPVYSKLSRMGWSTSITTHPPGLRLVFMPHVTHSIIDEFIPDLLSVLEEEGIL